MIRLLRGLFGTLRLRFSGTREVVTTGDVAPLIYCTHPLRLLSACTYRLGPKGKYAWLCRCQCGAWLAC